MFINSDSKALQWRDLTGPEKLKLFNAINIPSLFPDIPDAQKVQMLWTNFMEIYTLLRKSDSMSTADQSTLKDMVQKWIDLFLTLYQTNM